jgi:hypothetical protein
VRSGIRLLLESLRPNPAHVVSRAYDLLAYNPGGLRLLAGIEDWPVNQRNVVRYLFLHPAARELFDDWDNQIRGCVARLRALAGTDPDAPDLSGFGEVECRSLDSVPLLDQSLVDGRGDGVDAGMTALGVVLVLRRAPDPLDQVQFRAARRQVEQFNATGSQVVASALEDAIHVGGGVVEHHGARPGPPPAHGQALEGSSSAGQAAQADADELRQHPGVDLAGVQLPPQSAAGPQARAPSTLTRRSFLSCRGTTARLPMRTQV